MLGRRLSPKRQAPAAGPETRPGLRPLTKPTRSAGSNRGIRGDASVGCLALTPALRRGPGPLRVLAFKTEEVTGGALVPLAPSGVRYRFVVPQYVTTFGQSLRVVGSLPELGFWNPTLAPVMVWGEGHSWTLEAQLPQRSFEFKIIVCEGNDVRWEGGSNRVVEADGEEGDVPVEIVVWLTCHFNATEDTGMQLAIPRASIQDAYETGKATLEFLSRRRAKLGHDLDPSATMADRMRQSAEMARLSEAMAQQSSTLSELDELLGHAGSGTRAKSSGNGNGVASPDSSMISSALSDEDEELLLAIDSVKVPRVLRRISFANVVQASGSGPALPAAAAASSPGALPDPASAGPTAMSPFLRGELDSRAEDLVSAAGELLQELKDAAPDSPASSSLASLAEEAQMVAVALASLDPAGLAASSATQQLQRQLEGLASLARAPAGAPAAAAGQEAEEEAAEEEKGWVEEANGHAVGREVRAAETELVMQMYANGVPDARVSAVAEKLGAEPVASEAGEPAALEPAGRQLQPSAPMGRLGTLLKGGSGQPSGATSSQQRAAQAADSRHRTPTVRIKLDLRPLKQFFKGIFV